MFEIISSIPKPFQASNFIIQHYLTNLHGCKMWTHFFQANNVNIKDVKTQHYVTYLFVCNVCSYFFKAKTVTNMYVKHRTM